MVLERTIFCFIKKYDKNNNEIYYETSDGIIRGMSYDTNNKLIKIENILTGEYTRYFYDIKGHTIRIDKYYDHDIFIARYKYDDNSRKMHYSDTTGKWSDTLYDIYGREILVVGDHKTIKNQYNDAGDKIKISIFGSDDDVMIDKFEYDGNHHILYHHSYTGFYEKYEYDSRGNKICYKTSRGLCITYTYDDRNNCISMFDNSVGVTKFMEYDLRDNLISKKCTDGTYDYYQYDENNHKIFAKNQIYKKEYEYDQSGNLIKYVRRYNDDKEIV